jgi:GNAT superfamily N-acetyltransferase
VQPEMMSVVSNRSVSELHIEQIPPGRSLSRFVRVAWQMNASDPNWVPPLRASLAKLLDRRHPFHENADVAYFLATKGGVPVGRIAAILNKRHNVYHGENAGFFGFFESEEEVGTAAALFDKAAGWLRERGAERMIGPTNLSTNHECGMLVEGFETRPTFMMTHNPRWYPQLVEHSGLSKVRDLLAYWIDTPTPPARLIEGAERVGRRMGVLIRPIDMKRFGEEVTLIRDIYNSAWERNWGFVPMTEAEFGFMAREMKQILDPELCLIAEVRGAPVGFSLALPDLNQALARVPDGRLLPFGIFRILREKRRLRGFRVITLGLKPGFQLQGLGAALYLRTWQRGAERGYRYGEASWILEDNWKMRRALEQMGARAYKRYRMYERAI